MTLPHSLATLWLCLALPALAQVESVKPGINEKFLDPDLKVEEWTERFETESREIFHHRDAIVTALGLKPGMAVADIGAGTGLFALPFAEAVGEEGKVYAVEIARNFLDHIKARAKRAKATNIETVLGTDRSVELPEAGIDLAFICDVYHHFEYPADSLASLHRAIKPGGELVVIDFKRIPGESSDFIMGHVRAGQEVFEAEITAAGFEKVGEVKDLLTENYFVKFRRSEGAAVIPLEVRENLRIVYQVTDDLSFEGVNKGLFYARKLINTYAKQGIAADQVHLHLVFHGTGINALVHADARARLKAESAENPNAAILAELVERGVQVELCENTMQQKGVQPSELLPGVKLVVGAYPRLVDLQLQGCCYIKFE